MSKSRNWNSFIKDIGLMKGATGLLDGEYGDVPKPLAGDQFKFLRGDGTFSYVPGTIPVFTDEYYVDGMLGDDALALLDVSKPFKTIQACLNFLGQPVNKQDAMRGIRIHIAGTHSSVGGTNAAADSNFDGVYLENLVVPCRFITFYGRGVKIGNTNGATAFGNITQEISTGRRFGATSSENRMCMTFIGDMLTRDTHNRIRNGFHIGGTTRIKVIQRNLDEIQGDPSGPNDRVTIRIAAGQNPYAIAVSPYASSNVVLTDSTDTVDLVSHGFSNSTGSKRVFFKNIVGTTGITVDTPYCIVNATANTFQLSLTVGGAVLPLTTDGTGVLMATADTLPLENLIKINVQGTTNYNGSYDIIEKIDNTRFIAKRLSGTNTSSALETVGYFIETDSTGVATGVTHDIAFMNTYQQGWLVSDDGIVSGANNVSTGPAPTAGQLVAYSFNSRFASGITGGGTLLQRFEGTTLVWTLPTGSITSYSRTANVVTVNAVNASVPNLSWGAGDIITIATSASGGGQNVDGTWTVTGGGLGFFTFAQVGADYAAQTPTGAGTAIARSRINSIGTMENVSWSGGVKTNTFTYSTDDMGMFDCRWNSAGSIFVQNTAQSARMDSMTFSAMQSTNSLWQFPVTFTDAGDLVNRASHGLANGSIVTFPEITTTTGIVVNTNYYVVNAAASTFQVAASPGGAALALTTNGSGICSTAALNIPSMVTKLEEDGGIKNSNAVAGTVPPTVREFNVLTAAGAGAVFTQTASVTVANTVTETNLNGAGQGSLTLPANFFTSGRSIAIKASGIYSATASPTLRIQVKAGATVLLDTTAVVSSNDTAALWSLEGEICCRTVGATGTVFSQGLFRELGPAPLSAPMVNAAATVLSTVEPQALTITATWGTAAVGNTITMTNLKIWG